MQERYYYQDAQICKNGHIRNAHSNAHPEQSEQYCSTCGEPVIHACPHCGNHIRGALHVQVPKYRFANRYNPLNEEQNHQTICTGYPDQIAKNDISLPYYCHNCGEPYPWTQARLETADKIVDMLDELDDVQKKQLKETFPDLIVESPKTQLSALVAAKIMEKVHGLGRYVLIQWFEQNVLPTILTLMNLSRE